MAHTYIDVNKLVSQVALKIEIRGARRLRFRLWLGAKIMALAAWVMGADTSVTVTSETQQ